MAKKFIFSLLLLLSCSLYSGEHDNKNWPSFGRDLLNSRFNPVEHTIDRCNIDGLTIKWAFDGNNANEGFTSGSPSIVDGILYFGDKGSFYALNAKDGTPIWQNIGIAGENFFFLSPAVGKDVVFAPISDGHVFAFDRFTGAVIWEVDARIIPSQGIFGAAALIEKEKILIVVLGAANELDPNVHGGVVALNTEDGSILWQYATSRNPIPGQPNSGGPGVGIFGSPAVDTKLGYVIIGTGNNIDLPITPIADALIALNYRTDNPDGELVWFYQFTSDDSKSQNPKDWDASGGPYLLTICDPCGKKIDIAAVGTKEGNLYALNRKNGTLIWQTVLTNPNPLGSNHGGVNGFGCTDGKVIYVASSYSTNGQPLTTFSGIVDGQLVAASGVFAVNGSDGSILWRKDFQGISVGPLSVANKIVYFPVVNGSFSITSTTPVGGILRALNAKNGNLLFQYVHTVTPIAEANSIFGGATIYRGRVFLTGGKTGPAGVTAFSLIKR